MRPSAAHGAEAGLEPNLPPSWGSAHDPVRIAGLSGAHWHAHTARAILALTPSSGNLNAPQPDLWVLSGGDKTVEVTASGSAMVNNFGVMRQLGLLGLGIVTLHEPMVSPDLKAGRLQQILLEWVLREAPGYALMPSRLLPAKTRLFVGMLAARVTPQLAASFGIST